MTQQPGRDQRWKVLQNTLFIAALLYCFLVGINALGLGFKLLGRDVVNAFFAATSNPFVGLVVGILGTSLVQSSSVTTSILVGLVAAPENPLPLANAIPMIMGANIGTTVTNTVVSLAHIGRTDEFRRAFAVATCHDFFNFISVAILLPVELTTGVLSKAAVFLSELLVGQSGVTFHSPVEVVVKAGVDPLNQLCKALFASDMLRAITIICVAGVFIFVSLMFIVRLLQASLKSRAQHYVTRALEASPWITMAAGMVVTVMVQSSSITTSLLVPLAAAGMLSLERAFPITLGANVGTTVTGLLASTAVAGPNAQAGVTIALTHLLFNCFGILILYPLPALRSLPLGAARWLAQVATRSRRWALLYVVGMFYGLPALLIFVSRLLGL